MVGEGGGVGVGVGFGVGVGVPVPGDTVIGSGLTGLVTFRPPPPQDVKRIANPMRCATLAVRTTVRPSIFPHHKK